jgi:hypothetical protein
LKKFILVIVILLLAAYLFGCSTDRVEMPETASVPSPSVVVDTITPSIAPTKTVTPSPTFDSFRATSDSVIATNWAIISATLNPRGAKCDEGLRIEVPEVVDRMSNEDWSAFTCSPYEDTRLRTGTPEEIDYSKRYTEILSTDFSTKWRIYHDIFPWSNRFGTYLYATSWSQGGNYVFFVPVAIMSHCGGSTASFFQDTSPLYRFDLRSGEFEIILSEPNIYAYGISPDGKYLAYAREDEKKVVHIRDLLTGEEKQITLERDYVLTGTFVWHANNREVVFASALNGWEDYSRGFSLFVLDTSDMHLKTYLYDDNRWLIPSVLWSKEEPRWLDENTIRLISLNEEADYYWDEFTLNIRSWQINALPTPTRYPSITPTPQN